MARTKRAARYQQRQQQHNENIVHDRHLRSPRVTEIEHIDRLINPTVVIEKTPKPQEIVLAKKQLHLIRRCHRRRTRARRYERHRRKSYAVAIFRVLRQIYKDVGISKRAMNVIDCFMHDIFERIAREAALIVKFNKRKTMTPLDVEGATRLVLNGGELTLRAVHVGASAVVKFNNSFGETRNQV